MTKRAKRIGRPLKPAAKGKRVSLGLKVTAEVKRHIDSEARKSGRTQSQEAENLIERAFTYDAMFKAMRTTAAEIARGSVEAAFREEGYTPIHSPHGKIWVPKEYPIKRSGFIPPDEETQ